MNQTAFTLQGSPVHTGAAAGRLGKKSGVTRKGGPLNPCGEKPERSGPLTGDGSVLKKGISGRTRGAEGGRTTRGHSKKETGSIGEKKKKVGGPGGGREPFGKRERRPGA